jgi:decaprenylphospho-beta-D-erythro-pentofuranosid-2-ulose 2-reductase
MQDALGSPQSALVLGGTSEIGLATIRRLIDARCRTVVLAVRDPATAEAPAAELRARGAEVDIVAFDALDTASHAKVIGDVFEGPTDIDLVLLAFGVLGDQASFDADPEAAAEAARINYVGAVSSGLVVADHLRRQGHGTLVVLSSVAAERPRRSNYVYGSTKAGLDAFAQGLGDALHGSGARVLVVRAGFVRTRMTEGLAEAPMTIDPQDVAQVIVTALRKGRETVYAPGPLRFVMAGLKTLPRPLFRKLPM